MTPAANRSKNESETADNGCEQEQAAPFVRRDTRASTLPPPLRGGPPQLRRQNCNGSFDAGRGRRVRGRGVVGRWHVLLRIRALDLSLHCHDCSGVVRTWGRGLLRPLWCQNSCMLPSCCPLGALLLPSCCPHVGMLGMLCKGLQSFARFCNDLQGFARI